MKSAKKLLLNIDPSKIRLIACVAFAVSLSACTSKPTNSRYTMKQDTAPSFEYGDIHYEQVVPTYEIPNKWTSRPYQIRGKQYFPMNSAKGLEEHGKASWYGQKFHGHKTANGEIFDMFALTAAHKTLPLPSFVKVTNLQNGKQVIVRVNDRGPFHGDRILDLSYGAAKKLGFHSFGVTDIKMEIVHVEANGDITIGKNTKPYLFKDGQLVAKPYELPAPTHSETSVVVASANTNTGSIYASTAQPLANTSEGLFVQVMAMENGQKARDLATGLSKLLQVPTALPKIENIYKLRLGPLNSEQKANKIIQELKKIGFEQAFAVEISP